MFQTFCKNGPFYIAKLSLLIHRILYANIAIKVAHTQTITEKRLTECTSIKGNISANTHTVAEYWTKFTCKSHFSQVGPNDCMKCNYVRDLQLRYNSKCVERLKFSRIRVGDSWTQHATMNLYNTQKQKLSINNFWNQKISDIYITFTNFAVNFCWWQYQYIIN